MRKRADHRDRALERLHVRPAVGAGFEVLPDLEAAARAEPLVEILTDVNVDVEAFHPAVLPSCMYGASSARRNARARLSRDFVASPLIPTIAEVSSVDFPSMSLSVNTIL